MDDFWHKNLDKSPHTTGSFIEDFASANLPIKATQARGYNYFLGRVISANYTVQTVLIPTNITSLYFSNRLNSSGLSSLEMSVIHRRAAL